MIVLFIPNGIGDVLMAIPTVARLLALRGAAGVCIVVANPVQSALVQGFFDEKLTLMVRFDGRAFSHLRLFARLFFLKAEIVFAPMISRKLVNALFLVLLNKQVVTPKTFFNLTFTHIINSRYSLQVYPGHQVNYLIEFIADFIPIVKIPVSPLELRFPGIKTRLPFDEKACVKVAVGISCSEYERHKIPSLEWFARFINSLGNRIFIQVLLFCSSADTAAIHELVSQLQPSIACDIVIAEPLPQLLIRLSSYDFGVSGTSGQGHMMAASGLPIMILGGVTEPFESGPYTDRAVILRHYRPCGPCYQESFRQGCQKVRCMDELDITEGVEASCRLLQDVSFGQQWMDSREKMPPVSLAQILDIHQG